TLTTNLNSEISNRTAAVTAEATARAAADTTETNRAQGAEATLTTNLANEATTRAAADVTLGASIVSETTRATAAESTLTSSISSEASRAIAVEATKADLVKPVQSITGPPPTGTNVCVAGQMVLQLNGAAGQQLFICNASLDGWNAVNDDAATMTSDHNYTDQQVAAEATARQA